ncbi:MAG: hypothetical protein Q7T03_08135 [Deltaproteobacteria bacterium]|nr:hypothetical protein [Deltaproteobacteria bacterium]
MGTEVERVMVTRSLGMLPELEPLVPVVATVAKDSYLAIVGETRPKAEKNPAKIFVPREKLESVYPGVFFRGMLIFVEVGTLIAPGVIIDTDDLAESYGQIRIIGDSAIASGTILRGDVTIEKSKIRAGSYVAGIVQLTDATLGRGAKIIGKDILVYQSLVLGSVEGHTISINQSTISAQGSLMGTNIIVHPEEVISRLEIVSNWQFGNPAEEEELFASKP